MSISDVLDREGKSIKDGQLQPVGFFMMEVVHVNPSKTLNPGLVYDLIPDDYIVYLSGLGIYGHKVEFIFFVKLAVPV